MDRGSARGWDAQRDRVRADRFRDYGALVTPVSVRTLTNVLIVQTYYVHPTQADAYFEIHVAAQPGASPTVLVTRDTELYTRACLREGTDDRVDLECKSGKSHAGARVQVLDRMTVSITQKKGLLDE